MPPNVARALHAVDVRLAVIGEARGEVVAVDPTTGGTATVMQRFS
jgi:hypothetical protein